MSEETTPPERWFVARVEAAGTVKESSFTAATFSTDEGSVTALDERGHTTYYAERDNLVDITAVDE